MSLISAKWSGGHGRLYESPFSDVAPAGPETMFGKVDADTLVQVIEQTSNAANAA